MAIPQPRAKVVKNERGELGESDVDREERRCMALAPETEVVIGDIDYAICLSVRAVVDVMVLSQCAQNPSRSAFDFRY
ncbi:hypothetical protein [Salinicola peritrichatus]|uniref:hypothetical protein n=1 Tax=Salinicola peritrichatus TaxID=1267424 RepID=UPI0013A6136D|nr:hypothetical protein [Salinicola peritrichatus]